MNNKETLIAGGTIPDIYIPDYEIINRVLNGEKELYALIVRRYNQRLYRIGFSILKDDDEVEDVMQTAFIKVYENLPKFAFRSTISTWLTRIFINECLLRVKKQKLMFSMQNEKNSKDMYRQYADDAPNPLTKLLSSELKIILERAILQLPEKYRTVFIMREIEEMNIAETKECLEISEVNVKVRLNRAKAMLRQSLNTLYKKEDILHFYLERCDRIKENVMKQILRLS